MTYDDLIRIYGGCTSAARAIGRSKQTVHQWKANGIPFEQQYRIQLATKGKLKAELPRESK